MLYWVSSWSGWVGRSHTGFGDEHAATTGGDKYQGRQLYKWIVLQVREQGLAGAAVLRGKMGLGANTRRIPTFGESPE